MDVDEAAESWVVYPIRQARETYPIPCSTTARRSSFERTTRLLKRNRSSNVHSSTVSCFGDDGTRIKVMIALSSKCNEKRL